jgi:hypothetical protein
MINEQSIRKDMEGNGLVSIEGTIQIFAWRY